MSKIFLNHNFRCLVVTKLPDINSDDKNNADIENVLNNTNNNNNTNDDSLNQIIYSLCSDLDGQNFSRILNQIATTIIANGLYNNPGTITNHSKAFGNSSGLIPYNSKLYSHGSNTSEKPDVFEVRQLLAVKLKIDNTNEEEGIEEKLLTGHFRFHLPPIIPPQFMILVKFPSEISKESDKLLFFFHGNNKFIPIFTNYIRETYNCTITDLYLDNEILQECLNWAIMNDTLDSIGNIELWFGRLQTDGKLGTIVINIEEKDIVNLRKLIKESSDNDIISVLYKHLSDTTTISFEKIPLVKIKCNLFTISVDGRVRFTSSMSHLGNTEKQENGDSRLSIWWIIRHLCKNN